MTSTSKDPCLRELYELVTQYWAPKIRKSKSDLEKAPSEKEDEASEEPVTQEGEEEEELEDDEEVEAPNDEEVKAPAAEERKDESGEVSYRELLENLGLPFNTPDPMSAYVRPSPVPEPVDSIAAPPAAEASLDEQLQLIEPSSLHLR